MSKGPPISVCCLNDIAESNFNTEKEELSKQIQLERTAIEEAEKHQKHIEELAKPRKPFPGGPARLNKKPKTIAFGRTVNVSQCIEGRVLKTLNTTKQATDKSFGQQIMPNNSGEEKENAQEVRKEKFPSKTNSKITENKQINSDDLLQKLGNLIDQKFEIINRKNEQKFNELESKINERALIPAARHTEAARDTNNRNRLSESESRLLQNIENAFKENPYFIEHTVNLCKKYIPQIQNNRQNSNRPENFRKESSGNYRDKRKEEDYIKDDCRRNSTVTERITLERSYQQPEYPYSVDTATFLANRSATHTPKEYGQHSTYREGAGISIPSPSICRNRYNSPPPEPPKSSYKPGNSVTFAAHSTVYDDEFSDAEERNISDPEFDEDVDSNLHDSDTSSVHDLTQRQAERKARLDRR